MKGRSRPSPPEIQKESTFIDGLENLLFDIAHSDTKYLIVIEEYRLHVSIQRAKRHAGHIAGVDQGVDKIKSNRRHGTA